MTETAQNEMNESVATEGAAAPTSAQPELRIGVGTLMGRLSADEADKAA